MALYIYHALISLVTDDDEMIYASGKRPEWAKASEYSNYDVILVENFSHAL